jgi:hypothetical protein
MAAVRRQRTHLSRSRRLAVTADSVSGRLTLFCATRHGASATGVARGLKNLGQSVDGVLVKDELVADAVWACLDLTSGGSGEDVVELGGGSDVIGMRFGRSTRRW